MPKSALGKYNAISEFWSHYLRGTRGVMEDNNQTWGSYFIINGITDLPSVQAPIFALVLLIYMSILFGNLTILSLIISNICLHTPMYFFLGNLSILDMGYTTVTMHKILITYTSGDKSVSFLGCLSQMYFYVAFLCCEFMLLTAMSFDRFVAICKPLHYSVIMKSKSKEINHFFCDLLAFMKLFCNNVHSMENLLHIESVFIGFLPFSLTIMSYVYIIRTILKIKTTTGRRKAFYTCSSHLMVVFLLYVTIFCLYLRPTTNITLDSDKFFSLFYITLTPMLNPIIYSLKNKDVKLAFQNLINHKIPYNRERHTNLINITPIKSRKRDLEDEDQGEDSKKGRMERS
ncbi:olfactory receptor 5AR1-like [Pelobates fuscus]|uniref:olfactory receptor 5AR1-like n=1 Tax=Pelobates fuscus TaxID=191477 RepID=UPI002FE49FE4